MDAEWFVLFLLKPAAPFDFTDAGMWSRLLTLWGRIRRTRLYRICLSLPAICAVCLSLSVCLPPSSLSLDIQKNNPQGEWHLGPYVHQCNLNQTFEVSVCGHIYRGFRFRGFLFFIWHVSSAFEPVKVSACTAVHCIVLVFHPLCVTGLPKVEKDSVNGV